MKNDKFIQLFENTNAYVEKADREAYVSGVLATLLAHVEIPDTTWQKAMRTGHLVVEADHKGQATDESNSKIGRGPVVGLFAVAAPYEHRNMLKLK